MLALSLLSIAGEARAIPAFARKYGTSCLTCHVVYPKLNPFGEAFRRNGYRFPGVDSDYVKQETVALGQEANKKTFPETVWPASIPASVPIALGANGQAFVIPKSDSTAGRRATPGTTLDLRDLVAEGHLWAAAALDDTITFWAELTFAGSAEVEHAQVLFGDLFLPKHWLNLVVGKGFPGVTPFGPHSSYLADLMLPNAPFGDLLGNGNGWQIVDNYNGLELNGVVAGRVDWAVGLNAGASDPGQPLRTPTEDFYGRLGFKLGGLRSDGEGSTGPADPSHPWAETALHVYGFAYHSNTYFDRTATPPPVVPNDVGTLFGFGGRAQLGSLELNSAWYRDRHNHGTDAGSEATAKVFFAELSYVLFPWLVPAVRVENIKLEMNDAAGSALPSVNAWHVMPGVAFLIRPNIKVVAVANWEHADGFPSSVATPGTTRPWAGGSADWGAFTIAPSPSAAGVTSSSSELETIAVFFAWAI